MSQPSVVSGLQKWMREPQTVIRWKMPPPTVIAEELGECKKQGEEGNRIGPRYLRCIWKEWIQWAQRPAPLQRMLNSLTCYLVFDVQTTCSLCHKLVYSLTSLWPPWTSFLRATEMLSPRLGVLNIPTK